MKNIKYISKIMQLGALFLSANALAGKTIDWQAQSTACSTAATNLGSADAIVSHICDGWNTSCGTSGYNQGKVYSCKAVVTPNGNGSYSVGTIVTVTQNGTSGSAGWPGGSGVLKDDEPEQHCPTQHPVKIARGEKYYYFEDARRGGSKFPIVIERRYHAKVRGDLNPTSFWDFTYLTNSISNISGFPTTVYAFLADGNRVNFSCSSGSSCTMQQQNGFNYLLKKNTSVTPAQWELYRPDGYVEIYNATASGVDGGQLIKVINPQGYTHSVTYDSYQPSSTPVTQVTITDDQTLAKVRWTLSTSGDPLELVDITTGVPVIIRDYYWDGLGRLTDVLYPGDFVQHFNYDSSKNSGWNFLITGITEIDNSVSPAISKEYSNVTYDSLGRVTKSELLNDSGSGVESSVFNYNWTWSNTATTFPPTTSITNYYPYNGTVATRSSTYTFTTNGMGILNTRNWAVVSVTGDADTNTGCTATSSNTTYYSGSTAPVGFIKETVEKDGTTVTWRQRDAFGRITSMQTGLYWTNSPTQPMAYTPVTESQRVDTGYTYSDSNSPLVHIKTFYGHTQGSWVEYSHTTFTYDSNNNLLTKIVHDSIKNVDRLWSYTNNYYTGTKILQSQVITDPLGHLTTYNFDGNSNLSSIQNDLLQSTAFSNFNSLGKPQTVTDQNNVDTQILYDSEGRMRFSTTGSAVTGYTYYGNGLLKTKSDPSGDTITYHYNSAHQLTGLTNSFGEAISYTPSILDGKWTASQRMDSSNNVVVQQNRAFDALGRLWKTLDASSNLKTIYGYDANDNMTSIINQGDAENPNQVSNRIYDRQDRLTQETRCTSNATPVPPLNCASALAVTNYTYDDQGNIASVTDGNLNTTNYIYNGFGELIEQDSPDSGTTTYHYDSAGRLETKTDARNIVTQYSYDSINRLKAKYFGATPGGNMQDVLYSYDQNDATHGYGIGRLTSVSDQSGTTNYKYDELGRKDTKTFTPAGTSLNLVSHYTYTNGGALSSVTHPDGRVVTYGRTNDRLNTLTAQVNGTTTNVLSVVSYQPFGGINDFTRIVDATTSFETHRTYDADGLLRDLNTSFSGGGSIDLSYDFDPFNNIKQITNSTQPNLPEQFEYDGMNRLHKATGLYGRYTWEYDAVGNRQSEKLEQADATTPTAFSVMYNETYTYNTGTNRLSTVQRQSNDLFPVTLRNRSFAYDAAGNRTGDRKTIFDASGASILSDVVIVPAYGSANRMQSVTPVDCVANPTNSACQ